MKSYGVHENTGYKLKTLDILYWSRIGFGILAALIATIAIDLKVGNPLINGITVGLLVYIITYYLLKWRFMNKVEKQSKIFTTGIFTYFLAFILCWTLFTTPFLKSPTVSFTINPQNPVVGETITFDASGSDDPDGIIVKYAWDFGDENTINEVIPTTTYTYASAGDYTVTLKVVDDHGISRTNETILTVSASS